VLLRSEKIEKRLSYVGTGHLGSLNR
jgi:hypothetical protein